MKSTLLTLISLLLMTLSYGQIMTPSASPFSKVEQKVGLVDVTVEYSRPGKKGRHLFGPGALVEYDKLWRTGANAVTKVSFSDDVMINDSELKSGDYAILTTPGADMWKVHFFAYEGRGWGSYAEKDPDLTVDAKVMMKNDEVESFTINFTNFKNDGAVMEFIWGKTKATLSLGVATDRAVMASIDRVMAGPSANDYYNAAAYYHEEGKDLNQALEWIRKATKVENPRYWQVRKEALILADLGKKDEAVEAAKLSKELAMKAGNDDYVKMNEVSIKEWMK